MNKCNTKVHVIYQTAYSNSLCHIGVKIPSLPRTHLYINIITTKALEDVL